MSDWELFKNDHPRIDLMGRYPLWVSADYPEAIIRYANSRGADKVMYGGYFPMGLSVERIMTDMRELPLKDEVWPKFLRDNARKVLKLD